MNSKLLYFLLGFGIGTVTGIIGHKLYADKILKIHQEELDEYYDINESYLRKNTEEVNPVPHTRDLTPDEKREIKEKLSKNYEETTNYAAMYKGSAANYEHPVDSDEDEDEDIVEETDDDIALEQTLEHQETKDRSPKIISVEALGDLPPRIDMQTLFFYTDNEVLTNEEDEEIEDPGYFLGDALDKYDFRNNDEERIYVLNYATDTCYDVQKVRGLYE